MRQIGPLGENAGRAEPPRPGIPSRGEGFLFYSIMTAKVPLSKVFVPSEPAT